MPVPMLFSELVDKSDRKQVKKIFTLEKMSLSHGDRFALSRPLTEKKKRGLTRRKSVNCQPSAIIRTH